MFGTSTAGTGTHGSSSLSHLHLPSHFPQLLLVQFIWVSMGPPHALPPPFSAFGSSLPTGFSSSNLRLNLEQIPPSTPHGRSFPSPWCLVPKPPGSSHPAAPPPRSPSTLPTAPAPNRHRGIAQDNPCTLGRETCSVSFQEVTKKRCRAAGPAQGSCSGAVARPRREQPGLAAEKQVLQ